MVAMRRSLSILWNSDLENRLMTGGSAVVADHQARYIDGLEVAERETPQTGKIVVIPAGVGSADETAAISVVSEDDSVIAKCGDDDG